MLARRFAAQDEQTLLRFHFMAKLAVELGRNVKAAVFAGQANHDHFLGIRCEHFAPHYALTLPVADRGYCGLKVERADIAGFSLRAVEGQNKVAQGQIRLTPGAHEVRFYNILRFAQLPVEREGAGFSKSLESPVGHGVLRVSRPKLVVVQGYGLLFYLAVYHAAQGAVAYRQSLSPCERGLII